METTPELPRLSLGERWCTPAREEEICLEFARWSERLESRWSDESRLERREPLLANASPFRSFEERLHELRDRGGRHPAVAVDGDRSRDPSKHSLTPRASCRRARALAVRGARATIWRAIWRATWRATWRRARVWGIFKKFRV